MTATDPRPLLVLVNAGDRAAREPLLRSLAAPYRVHLITGAEPTWERPYLTGCSVLIRATTDAVVAEARRVDAGAGGPVAGVLSWEEEYLLQAALAAEALALPGAGAEAVHRSWDTFAARRALADEGVPQPGFALVRNVSTALVVASGMGYPVLLRPRAAAGAGVVRVRDADDLVARFPAARRLRLPHRPMVPDTVLVERFLPGPEISVDAVVVDGEATPVFIARRQVEYTPERQVTGHVVDGADPLLADPALAALLSDVHAALGVRDGWTHTVLAATDTGLSVLEATARLGGDLLPLLATLATGIDAALAAAAVACRRLPSLVPTSRRAAGIRFLHPPRPGRATQPPAFDAASREPRLDPAALPAGLAALPADLAALPAGMTALPAELMRHVALASPGAVLTSCRPGRGNGLGQGYGQGDGQCRSASAVAVADSTGAVDAALDAAVAAFHLDPAADRQDSAADRLHPDLAAAGPGAAAPGAAGLGAAGFGAAGFGPAGLSAARAISVVGRG